MSRLSLRQSVEDGDIIWLPSELSLESIGLVSGDTVILGRAAPLRRAAGPDPGQLCLVVVAGADLGSRLALAPGSYTVGRHRDADLQLGDEKVSRADFKISVGRRMTLDPGINRTNSLRHNGRVVSEPVALNEGDAVHVGATSLMVERHRSSSARPRDFLGAVPFHRTPEFRRPVVESVLDPLGNIPAKPNPRRFQLLAALTPLVSAVVMASIFGSARFLILALVSPVVAVANHLDGRNSGQKEYAKSLIDLDRRVREREDEVRRGLESELTLREDLAPYGRRLVEKADRLDPSLWGRGRGSEAFLSLRLGTGRLPAALRVAPEVDGELQLQQTIATRFERMAHLDTAPITIELAELFTVAVVGDGKDPAQLASGLTVQAACLHSPEDLVIAAAVDPRSLMTHWLKWLPHVRSTNSPVAGRHLAGNQAETDELLRAVLQIAEERMGAGDHGVDRRWPWMLVVVDFALDPDPGLLSRLLDCSQRAGISTICITPNGALVPRQALAVVEMQPGDSSAPSEVRYVDPKRPPRKFNADLVGPDAALRAALRLAPLIDATAANAIAAVPKTVTLFQTHGLSAIDGDWIAGQWLEDRGHSLPTVVGLTGSGPVLLDIVKHGPHGLIGGTSGSGKSELVQSLVAGLIALNSPERVNILFIDYKGGALSSRFSSTPHAVGAVTNLDAVLSLRALTSLKAELDRRMRLFGDLGVNDLSEALSRCPAEAPPSLVIVVDEFASLVRELPEFVEGIVSIAERGRSLGIHLLLSTQRPSGSINENIQQNVNLRISLRMLDAVESMNVIGTADAATIPTHMRGRAIARLGPGELVAFQSAWSGAPIGEPELTPPIAVASFEPLDPQALMLRTRTDHPGPLEGVEVSNEAAAASIGTQLDGLLSAVAKATSNLGMKPGLPPWRDTLPLVVPLDTVVDRRDVSEGLEADTPPCARLAVGLVDDPENQSQDPLVIDLPGGGGFVVYGSGGSGKTTTLLTTVAAAAMQDDLAGGGHLTVMGLDFASRQLKSLEALPQCDLVANGEDMEAVTRLVAVLHREFLRRQGQLASIAVDGPGVADLPTVLFVIDGYDNLIDTFNASGSAAALAEWSEMVSNLIDRGREVGIIPVVSTSSISGRSARLMNLISNRVTLRQVDDSVYRAFGLPGKLATGLHLSPGQGLTREGKSIQLACLTSAADAGMPDNGAIVELASRLTGSVQPELRTLPLPSHVAPAVSGQTEPLQVHLGTQDLTAWDASIDLATGGLCVIGPPRSGKSTALATVATQLVGKGHEVYVVGPSGSRLEDRGNWTACSFGRSGDIVETLDALKVAVEQFPGLRRVLVVDDLNRFDEMTLNPVLKEIVDGGVICVAAIDHSRSLLGANPLLKEMRSARNTLILKAEDEAAIQTITGGRFRLRPGLELPVGRGVLGADGIVSVVQVAH